MSIEKGTPVGVPGGAKVLRPKENIESPLRPDELEKFQKLLGDTSSVKEASTPKNPPLALIGEDDPQVRAYVGKTLKLLNFDYLEAVSGTQTLKFTLEHKPDLLMLDLSMPGLDGYEVLRGIRNYLKFTRLVIIILTGLGGGANEISTLSLGADDHLTKPIDSKRLEAKFKAFSRRLRST